DDPILIEGDIAIDSEAERNADPCTSHGCKWGKYTDGKVYIPYYIASHFSSREKSIITRGLESFSSFSCIRFRPSRSSDRDWLSIESQNGCFSAIGRRGGKQVLSLARRGCLYHGTVQHELLHALGFNHEQTRSDRDNHIKVLLHNVQSGMEHNFRKKATLNQGTPYDYNSVMQYHKYAFSKNNQPTMLPIPNSNVSFGNAKEMSRNDIARLNTLYKCFRSSDDPILIEGDIAIDSEAERNADPCTSRGCKWGKYTDGKVYIPYYIASHFSSREKSIITRGLESFSSFSCIRFRPSRSSDRDWLSIESQNGCYSYVGRRGGKQVVSLARRGCLYHGTVQHELLHALGFNHEQTRSDRDNHIKVLLQNVQSGMEHNFRKIATLNQGTPYDYNSVMQYHKYAFSKNNQPTMLPIPNSNVSFGNAKEMSRNDIARLNTLYKCCECLHEHIRNTCYKYSLYSAL
ncbi:High choriolytic enzyme 1, partial [Nibea albiflora]